MPTFNRRFATTALALLLSLGLLCSCGNKKDDRDGTHSWSSHGMPTGPRED